MLEDNPLKVKKRIGKFPKKSISNHELAIMAMEDGFPEKMLLEEKFLTYDYTKPNVSIHRFSHWIKTKSQTRKYYYRVQDYTQQMKTTTPQKHQPVH